MEETKEIMKNEASELSLKNEESKDAEVLYEDVSRRKENTKHFRMKNGNFMAVVYDEPVHKLNEKTGKLEEIKEEFMETEEEYEASTKHFKVKLPKKEGRRKFVTVEKDGKSVSFRFASGKPTHTKRPEAKMHSVKKHYWEHKKYPTLKYEKVDNITSLEYEVNDGGIKENIVLTKCPETSTFKFDMMCNGLTPKLSENKKRVILLDGNEEAVMVIPPANMTDDNGVYSEDIHYELCETENGTTLEMVVENDWLSAYERKYPVTIDPRVDVIGGTANETIMKQICSNGSTFMTGESFKVGVDANGNIHRVYMNVPIPEIESNAKIIKSELKFYMDSAKTVYDGNPYKVYYSNSTVNISNLNWYNQATIMGADLICTFRPYNTYETIDITKLIKNARENSESSKLIVFKHSLEEPSVTYPVSVMCVPGEGEDNEEPTPTPTPVTTYEKIYIYSSTADISKRPVAFVEYVSADKTVQHKKQYSFNCGDAGAASIDLATGSLTFVHDDAIGKSFRFTPPVAHIYKSVNADNETNNGFGIGWMLSPIQSFEYYGGSSDYVAKYTDSSGNVYYFVLNSDGTVTDELGMGLTLTTSHRTEGTTFVPLYYIEDEYDNKIEFVDYNNKIIQFKTNQDKGFKVIKNINGLYGTIMEDTISGIDNSKAVLEYSSNKLNSIKEYINETIDSEATMTYSEQYLSSITAANNKTTRFTYKGKYLGGIIDYKGIIYEFFYDDHGRVVAILTKGNSTDPNSQTVGEMVGIEYRNKSTVIKNLKTGVKTVYVLDEYGRERYSYLDISEAVDNTKITETTLLDFKEYTTTRQASGKNANGVYVSMSATVDKDASYQKNYFSNGCFEGGISDWTVSGTIQPNSESLKDESYIPGSKSFYFNSSSESYNKWISKSASFNLSEISGDMLVASAWCKSIGHSPLVDSLSSFKMIVRITYNDGTFNEYVENYDVACHTWQCAAITIKVDKTKTSATVLIKLDYSNNIGVCYFTNVRLVEADATYVTQEYDVNNSYTNETFSKIETISNKYYTQTEYYDENSDKIKTSLNKDYKTYYSYYEYDELHRVTKSTDPFGIVKEYTYEYDEESKEMEVSVKEYNKDYPSKYKYVKNSYDLSGRISSMGDQRHDYILDASIDPFMPKEYYSYNPNGTINHIIDKEDLIYWFEYDDNMKDQLVKINTNWQSNYIKNTMEYTNGYLTKVSSNGNNFVFAYDKLGRIKSIKIGNSELVNKTYVDNAETVITTDYANGETVSVYSDIFGNPVRCVRDENDILFTADYLVNGAINYVVDNKEKIKYNYIYNEDGYVVKVQRINTENDSLIREDIFEYENDGRTKSTVYGSTGHKLVPVYEKDASNKVYPSNNITGVILENKYTDSYTMDELRRVSEKRITLAQTGKYLIGEKYHYLSTSDADQNINATTDFIASADLYINGVHRYDDCYLYEYDALGNIVKFIHSKPTDEDYETRYFYDPIGRVYGEDNEIVNKSFSWEYDDNGNITKKTTNVSFEVVDEKIYVYSNGVWKDQLVSYDGRCCEYDAIGNPTTYLSNDLVWEGRRLKSFNNHAFDYNSSGIRIKKNDTIYTLDGDRILKETNGTNTLVYYYGLDGIVGFSFNGADYYYRKNLMGDITEIYSSSGELAASYVYDAFGAILLASNHNGYNIANVNPFRFKSYYYDKETGLYYLNSRYYDPETGRFISPDSLDYLDPETLGGINLYAYCNNNPVMYADPSGHSITLALVLLGTFSVGFGSSLFINAALNEWQLDWRDFAQATVDGLFAVGSTILAMTNITFWASVGIGAVMGWSQYAVGTAIQGGKLSWSGSLTAIGFGALGGAISGAGAKNTKSITEHLVGLSDDGSRAIGAITTAVNRRIAGQISQKGLQGVLNLYLNTAINAVKTAIPGTIRMLFMQSVLKIGIYTPIANISSGFLNYKYEIWGCF